MSADLSATADLYNAVAFRARVRSAVVEYAVAHAGAKPAGLVAAVLGEPERVERQFAALCADDETVSAAAVVDDADLRRVVADKWAVVALALGLT